MTKYDFDLVVIGGGSGGVRAARIASSHGARVAIAEEFRFGGTCVIPGCVPKKLMVYAGRFSDAFRYSQGFGWQVDVRGFDWRKFIAAKDKEISRLEGLYRAGLNDAGVTMVEERAVVAGPHDVKLVSSGRTMTAGRILIATGGWPNFIDIEGIEFACSSNEIFNLEEQPRSIVICGGGYIAAEFASIFAGLGSKVTLVYRRDMILRGFDDDLRIGVSNALQQRGIEIVTNANVTEIQKTDGGLNCTLTNDQVVFADQVMFAIGRNPNTKGLGLEDAGVELTSNGAVKVDENSKSSIDSIYAVGDVTDRVALTSVAIREGHSFADTVFGNTSWHVNYDFIPSAVFTTPEIGTVGLTEAEARAGYQSVDVYKASFRPMLSSFSDSDECTLMKLVVDGDSQRVLRMHVLGPDAAEMVQMGAIALNMGATKGDFDRTMALHPSAAEIAGTGKRLVIDCAFEGGAARFGALSRCLRFERLRWGDWKEK